MFFFRGGCCYVTKSAAPPAYLYSMAPEVGNAHNLMFSHVRQTLMRFQGTIKDGFGYAASSVPRIRLGAHALYARLGGL